ncbi:MAG TPA: hypothetical protein VIS96_06450 [Terrimicrobiaceae bacterium]
MNTRQLKKEEVEKLREYYQRLEALIRDCLENDEFRLAWSIVKAEGRITYSSRKYAEQAGLACIRGLGVVFDGVGFVVRQNRSKTAWRIRFFAARQLV